MDEHDIEETQMSHLKNGKILGIYNSEQTLELKNKVLHLETWKREIGITAVEEADKLKYEVCEMKEKSKQQDIEMLALQQENDSLQMQVETFEEEHDKWELEKEDLLSQLAEVSHERNASIIEEEHWAYSVKEQYHKIDKLTVRHRRSSSDLLDSQRTISELLTDNQVLRSENEQLKNLNNHSTKMVINIKEKLSDTENKLTQIQKKYDTHIAAWLIEKEKLQKSYQDLLAIQPKVNSYPSVESIEAQAIPFNPTLFRRRSRSIESQKSNDRLILDYIDIGFDEKEFDIIDVNISQIRLEMEQEFANTFMKEKQELNDELITLKKQYQQLKTKYDNNIQPYVNGNISLNDTKLFRKNQNAAMKRERKDTSCWIFPWVNCN